MIIRKFLKFIYWLVTIVVFLVIGVSALIVFAKLNFPLINDNYAKLLSLLAEWTTKFPSFYTELVAKLLGYLPSSVGNVLGAEGVVVLGVLSYYIVLWLVYTILSIIFFCLIWKKKKRSKFKYQDGDIQAEQPFTPEVSNDTDNLGLSLNKTTDINPQAYFQQDTLAPAPTTPTAQRQSFFGLQNQANLEGYIPTSIYKVKQEDEHTFIIKSADGKREIKRFDNSPDAFKYAVLLEQTLLKKYPQYKQFRR